MRTRDANRRTASSVSPSLCARCLRIPSAVREYRLVWGPCSGVCGTEAASPSSAILPDHLVDGALGEAGEGRQFQPVEEGHLGETAHDQVC